MAQYLSRSGKLQASRKDHFSVKYMEDLENLIGSVAGEICQWHIKVRLQEIVDSHNYTSSLAIGW